MNAKEKLAQAVGELLELSSANRGTLPHKIVSAVVQAMTEALHRGETVKIAGFGIFKIVAGKSRAPCGMFYNKVNYGTYIKELPNRKRVVFTPSKVLKRMLRGN